MTPQSKSVAVILGALSLSMASMGAFTAYAKDKKDPLEELPGVATEMFKCQTVTESTARLACYDKTVKAFEQARIQNDIVVADREQIREARRGLFGLTLPQIKLFGDNDDEQIQEISSTIRSVSSVGYGKYLMVLEDGAVWQQTEARSGRPPKSGQPIVIKRGSLGSYISIVDDGRAIKVKRIQQ